MYKIGRDDDAEFLRLVAQREVDKAVESVSKLFMGTTDNITLDVATLMEEADKLLKTTQTLRFVINKLKGVK